MATGCVNTLQQRSLPHTGVGPISSQQPLTPHQLYPARSGIYRGLVRRSGSVICFFCFFSGTSGIGELAANASYVCERFSVYWYWHRS